jgi:hypothetical protein
MEDRIAALLAKANASGATPEERDTYSAKAEELMIKYGIEASVIAAKATGELKVGKIITKIFEVDVPKSYSHEFAVLGCRVAQALNCKGFLTVMANTKRCQVVGFEADVALVEQLYTSLVRQTTLSLATWYAKQPTHRMSGTDRFNAKRGFISGFATAVDERMQAMRKEAVHEAGHGAELVLVDIRKQVDDWMARNFNLRSSAGRRYDASARGAGFRAGQDANIGQKTVSSGVRGPRAVGN